MNFDSYFQSEELKLFIRQCLAEDIGSGDHTSNACVPGNEQGRSRMIIKDDGILAGVKLAEMVFHQVNPCLIVNILLPDGSRVKKYDIALTVEGSSRSILTAERLVLNLCQRLSGIATATSMYVEQLHGLKTKVLDTRKTTPGLRMLEKWAVKTGGGENHRIGLYDMIMIKDNHVDFAGGIAQAIHHVHSYLKENNLDLKIEIETRSLEEVKMVLEKGGVHRIMLDNYSPNLLKEAVQLINGKYETEASGGITLNTIRSYAECGVDYISTGAITHSAKSLDISLKAF
ncbi:MAG: carboxylating nicotinate-nucleotide diphosphorylase [Bacteroidia bacterium]|nr:carboxylating nicotinate-nucleotide diphosphorylase [Bacteroidia bacterium]